MSKYAITSEGLSKRYMLGQTHAIIPGKGFHQYNRLSDTLINQSRSLATGIRDRFLGKGKEARLNRTSQKEFWALDNISFEIPHGETVGIIGRNGAGKSTLLKVLSRITEPTRGRVELNGRVASLLEVGTGFHAELTGRENIFLNGAILGMPRAAINRNLEAIVDFAGVAEFLDTPVKRYSSGMYVRLAFAVAAHLEPDILIVDEVLAVGDQEFQRKCLGKMEEVSSVGRTVLFVSHNIAAVMKLCKTGVYLKNGQLKASGSIAEVVSAYSSDTKQLGADSAIRRVAQDDAKLQIDTVTLRDETGPANELDQRSKASVEIEFNVLQPGIGYQIGVQLHNRLLGCIFTTTSFDCDPATRLGREWQVGRYRTEFSLPIEMLRGGDYWLVASAAVPCVEELDRYPNEIHFSVHETDSPTAHSGEGRIGIIAPILHWNVASI